MKEPRYQLNEVVIQERTGNKRIIRKIIDRYLSKNKALGYFYIDDFGYYGMCSEEHLTRWTKK